MRKAGKIKTCLTSVNTILHTTILYYSTIHTHYYILLYNPQPCSFWRYTRYLSASFHEIAVLLFSASNWVEHSLGSPIFHVGNPLTFGPSSASLLTGHDCLHVSLLSVTYFVPPISSLHLSAQTSWAQYEQLDQQFFCIPSHLCLISPSLLPSILSCRCLCLM